MAEKKQERYEDLQLYRIRHSAGAGGVRGAGLGREVAPRHRAARLGGNLPAEEVAVHSRRGGASLNRRRRSAFRRPLRAD